MRNRIEHSGWVLEKVVDDKTLELFDCGNDDLNDYERNGFVRAVLPEEDENPDSPTIPLFNDLKRVLIAK